MKSLQATLETAKQVLQTEAEAIRQLQGKLNDDFHKVVQLIHGSPGRVVVTGMGKSAIIGQKIVATLNSTGTPALFMHAADAVHGDLGMIQKDDVAICISNSGNTPEIKVLVPWIKQGGNKLVAMVGNTDSYLAQESDYVLDSTVEKEACPNNLAPTSSTTAQLALGDALAVCLLSWREFGASDFARYHPGGALGKRLYLRVGEIYGRNQRPTVPLDADLKQVILEISSKRLGATAVLDEQGKLSGVITDGDLRRLLQRESALDGILAKDIMSLNPSTIQRDELATSALEIMRQKKITQLIVLDGEEYLGIVHIHDLNKEGLIF